MQMEQQSKRPIFPIYDMMEQWSAFAFETPEVKPQHHALYFALVNQCKVRRGQSRFPLAYQHGMQASSIGSKATYLAALTSLQEWGFITYEPGANAYKTPIIEVHFRESTGNLLDLYRYSYEESTDTSTGRNKEVNKLEVERLEGEISRVQQELDAANAALAERKASELALQNELDKLKGRKAKTVPENYLPENFTAPPWADEAFLIAYFGEWLPYRQKKRDKLQPASVQKQLDNLGRYDSGFCQLLIDKAMSNGYTGLTYDDTPAKYEIYKSNQQKPFNPLNGTQGYSHRPQPVGLIDDSRRAADEAYLKSIGL